MTDSQPPFGGPTGHQPGQVPFVQPPAGPTPPPAAPAKRGNLLTSKPAIGAAALLIGVALGAGSAGGGGGATSAVPAPAPTVTVTTTATATPSVPTTSPSSEPTSEPTVQPESTPEPEGTTAEPKPAKKEYKTLSSRAFKKFAKDPDSQLGKTYVIYGEITQFDSATGTDTFRADTGPKKLKITYGYTDYSQNTILTGDESKIEDLVEGDCFKAKVTVLGSYSYDTQIGGNTTVPMLWVDSISVYGSTD